MQARAPIACGSIHPFDHGAHRSALGDFVQSLRDRPQGLSRLHTAGNALLFVPITRTTRRAYHRRLSLRARRWRWPARQSTGGNASNTLGDATRQLGRILGDRSGRQTNRLCHKPKFEESLQANPSSLPSAQVRAAAGPRGPRLTRQVAAAALRLAAGVRPAPGLLIASFVVLLLALTFAVQPPARLVWPVVLMNIGWALGCATLAAVRLTQDTCPTRCCIPPLQSSSQRRSIVRAFLPNPARAPRILLRIRGRSSPFTNHNRVRRNARRHIVAKPTVKWFRPTDEASMLLLRAALQTRSAGDRKTSLHTMTHWPLGNSAVGLADFAESARPQQSRTSTHWDCGLDRA